MEIKEAQAFKLDGIFALFLLIIVLIVLIGFSIVGLSFSMLPFSAIGGVFIFTIFIGGFFVIKPNDALILTFLGKYVGTVKDAGFYWTNPFASKQKLSLKISNFHSDKLKVNDKNGNPIEIAAVIVFQVIDTAKAVFSVEDYYTFVSIQSETALRTLATHFPYDSEHNDIPSLKGQSQELLDLLQSEIQNRLNIAGVEILDARISHLAYATEIAQVMLRRQQATAVIEARQKIVEGAIGMIEITLNQLKEKNLVELDNKSKATLVNNLMVTLISEQGMQPIVNTGG